MWISNNVQPFYSSTDEIELSCNSGASFPKAVLRWTVNDKPISAQDDCSNRLVRDRLMSSQMNDHSQPSLLPMQQLPSPLLIDATNEQQEFSPLSEDDSEQPTAKALNGAEIRWTEPSSYANPQASFLSLRLCANEQLWTKQQMLAKCESFVQLNFSRNSDLILTKKRNNMNLNAGKNKFF